VAIGALLVLVSGIYVLRARMRPRARPPARKIMFAVLPFENLSGDPAQEYFSDGLTEEMISRLGQMDPQRLGVIARTSAIQPAFRSYILPANKYCNRVRRSRTKRRGVFLAGKSSPEAGRLGNHVDQGESAF
jgi:hypothetical protein